MTYRAFAESEFGFGSDKSIAEAGVDFDDDEMTIEMADGMGGISIPLPIIDVRVYTTIYCNVLLVVLG